MISCYDYRLFILVNFLVGDPDEDLNSTWLEVKYPAHRNEGAISLLPCLERLLEPFQLGSLDAIWRSGSTMLRDIGYPDGIPWLLGELS